MIRTSIVIIILVIISLLHYFSKTPQFENEDIPESHPPENPITILDSAQMMDEHGTSDSSLESDLEIIHNALKNYRKVYNQNPIGLNDEITSALTGNNSKAIAFIPPSHPSIIQGELTDRHGTPYHFHANTGKDITIRSAGKDKQLFTQDDFTLNCK